MCEQRHKEQKRRMGKGLVGAQHRYYIVWGTMCLVSELRFRGLKLQSLEMLTLHLVKCSGFCVFTASTSTLHLNKCLYLMIAPYLFHTVLIRNWKYFCCTAWSIAPGHQLSRSDISWILLIKIHKHLVIHIKLLSPRLKMGTWVRGMWSDSPKGAQQGNVRAMNGTQTFSFQFLLENIAIESVGKSYTVSNTELTQTDIDIVNSFELCWFTPTQ